ncbi:hypothetical protein 04086_4628 [Escherichia phage 04086]|nr:hypothetical protein 04086_4628 [Escherichia phage 04086]
MESFFSASSDRVFTINCAQGKYLAGRVIQRLNTTNIKSNQMRNSTTNHTHYCRPNLSYSTRSLAGCDIGSIITVVTTNFSFGQERTKCFGDFFITVFRGSQDVLFLVFENFSDDSLFRSTHDFRKGFVFQQSGPFLN